MSAFTMEIGLESATLQFTYMQITYEAKWGGGREGSDKKAKEWEMGKGMKESHGKQNAENGCSKCGLLIVKSFHRDTISK